MKASELREKTVAELNEALLNIAREQFNLRMQAANGQSRPSQRRALRRDVARVKTILTEKAMQNG